MARRSFTVVDITEILTHWHAGRSINEMSVSLGVDRKTIRKYLQPAIAAGLTPGGNSLSPNEWNELIGRWFPELTNTRLRQVTWPDIDRHAEYIKGQLAVGVTQATVWQRLRDEHGLAASVASFRRWVAATVPEETRRAQVTVLRDEVPAGEEAQIDYGLLGTWIDPVGGKRRKVWALVIVLACSRHVFVQPTFVMDQAAWTQAHVDAFAFFGGTPRRLIPDNLRTGVDRPDLYDPKMNRSYGELAVHYGVFDRSRSPRKTQGQAPGGTPGALCPGQLLAGQGVHLAGADARAGVALVRAGGRVAFLPAAGRRQTLGGVHSVGGRSFAAVAA